MTVVILRQITCAMLALALSGSAAARSRAPVRAFMAEHPCPETGKVGTRCPGYVVDHTP